MKNIKTFISIITVNYNSLDDTIEFLDSIFKCEYPDKEIIVIDNHSKEDPTDFFATNYPSVIFLRTSKNLGFAKGNNLGIALSKGEIVFFLNNDTIIESDFIPKLVDFVNSGSDIGFVSPKILFPDKRTIQYAGSNGINMLTGRGKRIGMNKIDRGQFDHIRRTKLGHGGAMIVPREVIEKIGEIPDCYFLYYEEHDWVQQIIKGGYGIYYYGLSSVIHKESKSIGKNISLKTYYLTRNRLLFLKRNTSGIKYFLSLSFFYIVSLPYNVCLNFLKADFEYLKAFFAGIYSFLKINECEQFN